MLAVSCVHARSEEQTNHYQFPVHQLQSQPVDSHGLEFTIQT